MLKLAAALLLIAAFAAPLRSEWTVFVWESAGITLTLSANWTAAELDAETLSISDGAHLSIRLKVLESGDPVDALAAELPALDLLHYGYQPFTLYGRPGWQVDAVTADRAFVGAGRVGYLPDDRLIAAVARWTDDAHTLDQLFAGLSLSAPIFPAYQPVWTYADHDLSQIAYSESGVVYALNGAAGVIALHAAGGALIGEYLFEHPTQPTDITADAGGTAYIADIVCRCLLRLRDGAWIDPVGAYAGNAPLGAAIAPDGAIYAIDRGKDGGYALNISGQEDLIPLHFNAAAPPFVVIDGSGNPLVVERLTSLLDGTVTGYRSSFAVDRPPGDWLHLPLSAENIDVTGDGRGGLVIAGATIAYESEWDSHALLLETGGRSAALSGDGQRLFVIGMDGALTGYRKAFPADRGASPTVLASQGVGCGVVSERAPGQTWTYAGRAGEIVTFSAVDPARDDPYALGLDIALRVYDPNGNEIAYNDDQAGADLFGAYDAQIPDLALPADGMYTIVVEWVAGSGSYLISARAEQRATAGDDVIRVSGRLMDAAPVERWTFDGEADDVITVTMMMQTGDLDPALELIAPDGSRLAYNDDTPDPVMGVNAQINRARLPVTGRYTVEASRFDGSGRYELVILKVE
jgi:hypothetical protein